MTKIREFLFIEIIHTSYSRISHAHVCYVSVQNDIHDSVHLPLYEILSPVWILPCQKSL